MTEHRNCVQCKSLIPKERLEVLPETQTCVNCSNVAPKFGLMEYAHKTAGSIVIVEGNDHEAIRRMKNCFHRKR